MTVRYAVNIVVKTENRYEAKQPWMAILGGYEKLAETFAGQPDIYTDINGAYRRMNRVLFGKETIARIEVIEY